MPNMKTSIVVGQMVRPKYKTKIVAKWPSPPPFTSMFQMNCRLTWFNKPPNGKEPGMALPSKHFYLSYVANNLRKQGLALPYILRKKTSKGVNTKQIYDLSFLQSVSSLLQSIL